MSKGEKNARKRNVMHPFLSRLAQTKNFACSRELVRLPACVCAIQFFPPCSLASDEGCSFNFGHFKWKIITPSPLPPRFSDGKWRFLVFARWRIHHWIAGVGGGVGGGRYVLFLFSLAVRDYRIRSLNANALHCVTFFAWITFFLTHQENLFSDLCLSYVSYFSYLIVI